MINAKKKGNAGEQKFANFLQANGFKAYKNSSSGGNMWKSDVHNDLGMNIEVKTCKAINLKKCWAQTERDASMSKQMPILAVHFDQMPEGSWLMVMESSDWVEFMKGNEVKEQNYQDPKFKWALQGLIEACKKVIKFLE